VGGGLYEAHGEPISVGDAFFETLRGVCDEIYYFNEEEEL
jgi:hypothetical protein